jgi:hypothetical protein
MGYIRLDCKKNVEIREHLNAHNTVNQTEKYQNNWLKHLKRMNTNRIPVGAFKNRPAGRRDNGRLSRRRHYQLHLER